MPGLDGAVRCTVLPGAISPVLNALFRAVKVWSTLSSLVTVMVAPGATVNVSGWKAKFLMTMCMDAAGVFVDDAPVLVAEALALAGAVALAGSVLRTAELVADDVLEHAASPTAPTKTKTVVAARCFHEACPRGGRNRV